MSFKTTLKMSGKEFDVLDANYRLNREVDAKGRPSSGIHGGKVYMRVESTDDTVILATMVTQFTPFSGSLTFKKGDEESKMKELSWEEGYIVEFDESIDVNSMNPMTIRFVVSAKTLKVGDVTFEQDWPK